jgi:hypothetical protein
MKILFTRLTNETHRLECIREDGSKESAELETKSLLKHDLIHLAVEKEAGLKESFWGLVSQGKTFADLSPQKMMEDKMMVNTELAKTEMVVGLMTGFLSHDAKAEDILLSAKSIFEGSRITLPSYLTADFMERVKTRYRSLSGQLNGTPFHETIELSF